MTQAENPYRQDVFLEDLRKQKGFQQQRIWAEHQQMQLSFCSAVGSHLPPQCSTLVAVLCVLVRP